MSYARNYDIISDIMKFQKSFQKIIVRLLYIALILACLAIVWYLGRPPKPDGGDVLELPATESDAKKGTQEEPEETKPKNLDEFPEETRRQKEDEWYEAYRRWRWKKEQKSKENEPEEETLEEETPKEPYVPPTLMLASDLHFISRDLHDSGQAFQTLEKEGDGKILRYSDILVDAFLDEALEKKPSALILAGDNTLNGERANQEKLAKKLRKLQKQGVQVLIIPGNHDIQNVNAGEYFGDWKTETEYLHSADEFLEIFHEFGYDQALSRDPDSLSYVYALDETHWVMMLDSCRYEDRMYVSGRIREKTLEWMEKMLVQAAQEDIAVVPVAHHNLLSESRLYKTECTLENHEEVVKMLELHGLPVYFSGHLHAQRIKKHKNGPGIEDDDYGITEIVLGPLSIPPCQYGFLCWDDEGGMAFETCAVNVAAWTEGKLLEKEAKKASEGKEAACPKPEDAQRTESPTANPAKTAEFRTPGGSLEFPEESTAPLCAKPEPVKRVLIPPEENLAPGEELELPEEDPLLALTEEDLEFLLDFPANSEAFVKELIAGQIITKARSIPQYLQDEMAGLYSRLYFNYCAGRRMEWGEVRAEDAYRVWEKFDPSSPYVKKMKEMADDANKDQYAWECGPGEGERCASPPKLESRDRDETPPGAKELLKNN